MDINEAKVKAQRLLCEFHLLMALGAQMCPARGGVATTVMTYLPGLAQSMVKQIAERFSRGAQPEKDGMCQLFVRVHEVR
eukprot:5361968-Pyramimonas_sp.AAC.1